MEDDHSDRSPRRDETFLLQYRETAGSVEVAIVKVIHGTGTQPRLRDVWNHFFPNPYTGRTIFELLSVRHERLTTWGKMAELLGPQFLDGVIDGEVAAPCEGIKLDRMRTTSSNEVVGDVRKAEGTVTMRLVLHDDAPRVVGRIGERTFLMLGARTVTGARRIWDWVRWQHDAYRAWANVENDRGALALVRMILDAMIEQERLVTEAGSVRDPERPLRYWRPRMGGKGE